MFVGGNKHSIYLPSPPSWPEVWCLFPFDTIDKFKYGFQQEWPFYFLILISHLLHCNQRILFTLYYFYFGERNLIFLNIPWVPEKNRYLGAHIKNYFTDYMLLRSRFLICHMKEVYYSLLLVCLWFLYCIPYSFCFIKVMCGYLGHRYWKLL